MTRLTLEQVQHVARLAALSLSEQEALAMCGELGSILDLMASLEQVDVADVEPTFHPLELGAAMRPDVVQPSALRDEMLAAAPDAVDGGFAVPQVREGDS